MYLLGFDVGSSSVKVTLLDAASGKAVAAAISPEVEMAIDSPKAGFAEQRPGDWWENIKKAMGKIRAGFEFDTGDVKAIGISYQMHGLVAVDKNRNVLRPAIIWCDSRAVEIGSRAASQIGEGKCLKHLCNLPGNFTVSKLKWVMENEPDIYKRIYKIMLPGDFIAMKMTGEILTSPSGLSEGIMWDFLEEGLAGFLLEHYGIDENLIADRRESFSVQGQLTSAAAELLGLKAGTVVSYRAGDQPNNALSLNVLNPGEVAATAGTSGVVYGISDKVSCDEKSRVNTFVHVNHSKQNPRYGTLLCINGTGILNSWLKTNVAGMDYDEMNELAAKAPVGSDSLAVLPYGNGAERTLGNKDIGAQVCGLNFNRHRKEHLLRAGQEGIVFALNYGLDIMKQMGMNLKTVRAGQANMFLSPLFAQAFATVTGCAVELYNTDGSQGAARGAGIGAGIYADAKEAFGGLKCQKVIEPDEKNEAAYRQAYENWLAVLQKELQDK